ncbi:exonuclease domain-containing protein [Paenarthrobacter sp. NPDC092416]|uniref:3'-5' exonuclease n=1 Tax=Paenarthrobacter sp. NPDC092416 TaxID=3364386 RepID=UPI0037F6CD79
MRILSRRESSLESRDWKQAEYCVMDLETTGLNSTRDRIISYGLVPVLEGRIRTAEAVYGVVNPGITITRESVMVHALRQCDVAEAPDIDECFDEILMRLEGRILVAHSAWIEVSFLAEAAKRRKTKLNLSVVDTAVLAGKILTDSWLPSGHDIALEYASAVMGLPPHTPHHALGDAMTTAQVFLALGARLSADGLTAGDLIELSRR